MDDKRISTNDDKQENKTKPHFLRTEKLSKNPVVLPGIESNHAHLTYSFSLLEIFKVFQINSNSIDALAGKRSGLQFMYYALR